MISFVSLYVLLMSLRRVSREMSAKRENCSFILFSRCALLCQTNGQVKYEAACLMVLLLFDEAAVALPDNVSGIPFSLPKPLVRR